MTSGDWNELRERKRAALDDPSYDRKLEQAENAVRDAVALTALAAARRQLGFSQTDVAEVLGVSKSRVSNLERQDDIYLSTLRNYIEAIGGRLEVTAVLPAVEAHPGDSHKDDGSGSSSGGQRIPLFS